MHTLHYTHYIKCFANWVYCSVPVGIWTGFAGLVSRFSTHEAKWAGSLWTLNSKFTTATNCPLWFPTFNTNRSVVGVKDLAGSSVAAFTRRFLNGVFIKSLAIGVVGDSIVFVSFTSPGKADWQASGNLSGLVKSTFKVGGDVLQMAVEFVRGVTGTIFLCVCNVWTGESTFLSTIENLFGNRAGGLGVAGLGSLMGVVMVSFFRIPDTFGVDLLLTCWAVCLSYSCNRVLQVVKLDNGSQVFCSGG